MRKRYELKKKEELETSVYATAFVTEPAIQLGLVYLSNNPIDNTVKLEKGIAYSPVLIPDQVIPRKSESGEEYEVFFSTETIEQLAQDYMNAGSPMKNWNSQHNDSEKLEGIAVVENWIVEDPQKDKAAALGFKVPKGTWMQGIKVNNEKAKERIKSGEYFGISIEGDFEHIEKFSNHNFQQFIKEEMKSIKEQIQKLAGLNQEPTKEKFGMAELENGSVVYYEGEELEEGKVVYLDEALTEVAPEGRHTLASGEVIVLDGSSALVAKEELKKDEEMKKDDEEMSSEEMAKAILALNGKFESLKKENETLSAENAELKEKFESVSNSVEEHKTKLAKIDAAEAPESVTKLQAQENTNSNNYLHNRKTY